MSKEKSLKNINHYLDLYSQEQLDLIESIITTYAHGMIDKGKIMDIVYTSEERNKIDSALPHDYVMAVRELLPSFDTFNYVYNYNEPNRHGAIDNIFEALHTKLHTVLNDANFEGMEVVTPTRKIAVIDSSVNGLFIYDIPKDFNTESIEEFMHQQGRHLSNCNWGEFDGEIIELTNE